MNRANPASPEQAPNPVFYGLARILDVGAGLLSAVARSRLAVLLAVVALFAGALATGLEVTAPGDATVYDIGLDGISASRGGRYVRVSGRLDTSRPYQSQMNLGPLQLRGGEWVSLNSLTGPDRLWVSRETLPAGTDGVLTLVGRLTFGSGQEPPIFLEVMAPPDVAGRAVLAQAGWITTLIVLAGFGLSALAARAGYAPALPTAATAIGLSAPPYAWFGEIRFGLDPIVMRNAPVEVRATRLEARVEGDGWATAIRRARWVSPIIVASRFGALPAVRIQFEDERGLRRMAVLAASTTAARDQLVTALRFIGNN